MGPEESRCFILDIKDEFIIFVSGNADGMGSIRKDELRQACAVLRVNPTCLRRDI